MYWVCDCKHSWFACYRESLIIKKKKTMQNSIYVPRRPDLWLNTNNNSTSDLHVSLNTNNPDIWKHYHSVLCSLMHARLQQLIQNQFNWTFSNCMNQEDCNISCQDPIIIIIIFSSMKEERNQSQKGHLWQTVQMPPSVSVAAASAVVEARHILTHIRIRSSEPQTLLLSSRGDRKRVPGARRGGGAAWLTGLWQTDCERRGEGGGMTLGGTSRGKLAL